MLRTLAATALLCLSCSVLEAQHLSPLFGVLASHSPLQRPELFQQLQDDLPDYLKDIEPGLRMPFLDEKFQEFESKLYNAINGIKAQATGDVLEITDSTGKIILCKITWSTKSFTESIKEKILNSNSDVNTFLWRLVSHINDPILRKYAYAIRDTNSNDIDILLKAYLIKLSENSMLSTAQNMANYINTQLKDFREKIIQAAHIAESEFNEVAAQASNYFVKGNIGLSLTSGEGTFAGGILIGIKGKCGGLAGFTNLIGSSLEENKKPGISQIGLRGYLQSQKCEYDLFISGYLGSDDSAKKDFHSYEVGGGISFRCGETLTIGFAGTYLQVQGNENPSFNLGLLLNGVSQYLPTFVVGAGYQKGMSAYPIFQIIQPINAR